MGFFSCGKLNTYKMYCFGVLALLNVIIIHLTSGKPFENQGTLLVMENSHKNHNLKNAETEAHSNFNAFLENLKANFLRSLNLTEIPSQEKMKEEPPQFMIDLYNRYTKDKSSSPISNIVRSFSPEDVASLTSLEADPQKHILLFNISIPWQEDVSRAELRVHIACQKETGCFSHLQGNLAIYDVLEEDLWEKPKHVKSFLVSKEIQECGWVMFDVSNTVKRWVKVEKTKLTIGQLEMVVQSHGQDDLTCGKLRISMSPDSSHLPLLVVFSNDHGNRIKEKRMEMEEMIIHEQESVLDAVKNSTARKAHPLPVGGIHHSLSRRKRSTELHYCRRTSLRVHFKEIGWKWIIAPEDYEAFECKGGCFFPLTDNVTPTKHAIVQTLVHYKNPKKAAKACCVPTKLNAISILYKDDAGTPTLKYQYEGMQVAECGCR